MTMPLMPYSAIYEPEAGSISTTVPVSFRNQSDYYISRWIKIPAGVNLLRFTWAGVEGLRYRIDHLDMTGSYRDVLEPVSSVSPRSSKAIEVASDNPVYIACYLTSPASAATISARLRVGLTVIPTGFAPQ